MWLLQNAPLFRCRLMERAAQQAWWARAWFWLSVCCQRHVLMRSNVPDPSVRRRPRMPAPAAGADATALDSSTANLHELGSEGDPSVDGGAAKAGSLGSHAVADILADAKARLPLNGAPAVAGGGTRGGGAVARIVGDIEMGVLPPEAGSGLLPAGSGLSAADRQGSQGASTTDVAPLLTQQVDLLVCQQSDPCVNRGACHQQRRNRARGRMPILGTLAGLRVGSAVLSVQTASADLDAAPARQQAAPPAQVSRRSPFQLPSLQLKSLSEDSLEAVVAPSTLQHSLVPLLLTSSHTSPLAHRSCTPDSRKTTGLTGSRYPHSMRPACR